MDQKLKKYEKIENYALSNLIRCIEFENGQINMNERILTSRILNFDEIDKNDNNDHNDVTFLHDIFQISFNNRIFFYLIKEKLNKEVYNKKIQKLIFF